MGITVDWDNSQKTIIRQVYGSTWNWDEYIASFKRIDELISEVDYPVGIIADTGAVRRIPPNAIVYGSRAISQLPRGVVLAVVVSPSVLVLSIMSVIQKLTSANVCFASTVDEARRLIEAAGNNSPFNNN